MPAEAHRPDPGAALQAALDFWQNLEPSTRILVAISGGSDSTGLLLALSQAATRFNIPSDRITAATIDHGLRAGSADEARTVAGFCASLGIQHQSARWEGDKPKTGLMAAARLARYRLLADVAKNCRATVIVTGHTADDQRETIAMRAARSKASSSDVEASGLSGMAAATLYNSHIWILRPFLSVQRSAIRAFLTASATPWIDDPSNENQAFERIRVRTALATETADLASSSAGPDREALSIEAADWLSSNCRIEGRSIAVISHAEAPFGDAAFRAMTVLIAVLGGKSFTIGREQQDKLRQFLGDHGQRRISLGRVILEKQGGRLYAYRERRNLPEIVLEPGRNAIWDGRFRIENQGSQAVTIGPEGLKFPGLGDDCAVPQAIANRAASALPHVSAGAPESTMDAAGSHLTLRPHFALFDLFLSSFDLPLANAVALAFARQAYPRLPVHQK